MTSSLRRFQQLFYPMQSQLITHGPEPLIDSAEPLGDAPQPTNQVIYVGKASQFPTGLTGVNAVLIQDIPVPKEAWTGNNLILLPGGTEPALVFSKIREYLTGRTIFARKTDTIYEAYLRREGLQALLDVAAECLGCGLALCDGEMALLACSSGLLGAFDAGDSVFRHLKENVASIPVVDVQCPADEDIPLSEVIPTQAVPCIPIGIRRGSHLLAYLLVKNDGIALKRWDLSLVAVILRVLSAELPEMQTQNRPGGYSFEKFLIHLLEDSLGDAQEIRSSAELFHFPFRGYFALFLMNMSQYQRLLQSAQSLRSDVLRILGGGDSAIYRDSIAVLYTYPSQEAYETQDLSALGRYLNKAKVYGTRSRLFYDLTALHSRYKRARYILDLHDCAPAGQYWNTEADMGLFPLVGTLLRYEKRENLIEPAVQKLMEVDKSRKTAYVDTLYMYLKCARNPTAAREKLFIHRNTLDYRLQRIVELTGIDWSDGDRLFRLYLSVCAVKYLESRRQLG